jgi:hypothetical protein
MLRSTCESGTDVIYPACRGRKNERYRDNPDFRPAFTFDEAGRTEK